MRRQPKRQPRRLEDPSTRDLLAIPAALCGFMLVIGLITSNLARVDPRALFYPYLSGSLAVTLITLLVSIFCWAAVMALRGEDDPLPRLLQRLKDRAPFLLLPAVIFPLFLVEYTASKTAIPFLVGYPWDRFWADADRMIFGRDVWIITHHWFGAASMPAWEWLYTVGWGSILVLCNAIVAINARPRLVPIFYTAMLSTWLIGGCLMAYTVSASGPVFAHLFDPSLADRFSGLREILNAQLSQDGAIRKTQHYLASAVHQHVAVFGGGISAMPSMHLGAASIYCLAARGTKWIGPACLFWLLIFIGSGHFGYHYWTDGIVALAVAYCCWRGSVAYYGAPETQPAQGHALTASTAANGT